MFLRRLPLPMLGLVTLTAGMAPVQAQTRLDPYGSPPPAPSAQPAPRARALPPAPAVDPVTAAEQKASSNINASNDYFVRLRQDIQRRQQKVAQLEAELARREKAYREMTQDLNDQAQTQRGSAAASLAGAGTATPAPAGGAAEQGGGELTQKYKQAEQQALYMRSLKYDIVTQKKEIARLSQLLKH